MSTILDLIDNGDMALPKFQRGYVWNRDQVRGLMDSLYRRHPVGSLLVWATAAQGASHRGEHELAPGVVRLLLDGQQRITSLYGIIRGAPPAFFDGNARAFTDLYFHIGSEDMQGEFIGRLNNILGIREIDLHVTQVTVGRRNRAFEAPELVEVFMALERQLASPEGDTLVSEPIRRVPRRRR